MSTAIDPRPPMLPSAESLSTQQAIIIAHRHLRDAVTGWDTSTGDGSTPPELTTMRGLIQAARDLLDAAGPLIEHLPVITAALGDAIAYRHDDGGACHDCHSATNQRCSDHVNDTAIAAAFHTALTAITS